MRIMEKTNNKEIINLLDSLSESESDVSDLVLTPRKRKVKRRPRPGVRVKQSKSCSCNRSQTRIVSLWLAAVLITFWLIALSWLAAVLYSEIGRIDVSIRSEVVDSTRVEAAAATTTTTTTTTTGHGTSSPRDRPRSIIETLAQVRIYDKRNDAGYQFGNGLLKVQSSERYSNTSVNKACNSIELNEKFHIRTVKSDFYSRCFGVTIER